MILCDGMLQDQMFVRFLLRCNTIQKIWLKELRLSDQAMLTSWVKSLKGQITARTNVEQDESKEFQCA